MSITLITPSPPMAPSAATLGTSQLSAGLFPGGGYPSSVLLQARAKGADIYGPGADPEKLERLTRQPNKNILVQSHPHRHFISDTGALRQ
ncbi:MAG: hypothetical protein ABIC57_03220, partial [bacterium]